MQWYYAIGKQQFGPVEEAQLIALVREGKVGPDDLVWNPDLDAQWAKAGTIPLFFPPSPGMPSPAPGDGAPPMTPAAAPGHATPRPALEPGPFTSRTHNRDLMTQARECLRANWGIAVGFTALYVLLNCALNAVDCCIPVASLLLGGPLLLGLTIFFLALGRSQPTEINMLFAGFKNFGNALGTFVLVNIFTLLWLLLLIVPGIIAALRYAMAMFLIADNPTLGPLEAIRQSKRMMHGNKWKFFCLQWRFFGWCLLGLLTCGIGWLWLFPYIMTSQARFYEDLRQDQTIS
jgi:uncharacterized membrane protein